MKEVTISDFSRKENYKIIDKESVLALETPTGDIYELQKRSSLYNSMLKVLGFNPDYEYTISDVNRHIISVSCEITCTVDKRNNPIIGIFKKGYEEYIKIAIDANLRPYITEGSRRLHYYNITDSIYKNVFNICIKIFGEDLCRKSAFTYAQIEPVYEKNHKDGTVTLTGEFFRGEKRPDDNSIFKNLFLHESGFEFKDIKSYDIDKIPIDYLYENMTPIWKDRWKNLFLCMQPGGQWWISNGMEYSSRENGWKRFDSNVYFSIFDTFYINPIDDCTRKFYLRDYQLTQL